MVSRVRTNFFWILGTALIFAGVRLASAADRTVLGSTDLRYYSALILAFGLLLAGGLLWISVGGALGKEL